MSGSIIRRIITGFGITLLLTLAISVIGVFALHQTRNSNAILASQVLTDDVYARDAESHFLKANQSFLRILLDPTDPKWRTARDEEIKTTFATVSALHDSVEDDARPLWSSVDSLLHVWDNAAQRSVAAATSGKGAEALQIRTREIVPVVDRIEAEVGRGVQVEVKDTRRTLEDSRVSIVTSTEYLVGASIVTIIVGIFFSWLVIRSVTQPLHESTGILATSSAEILAATSEQASGANESMAAVAQTAATVDQVAQTTEQAAQRARTVAEGAQRANEISRNGRAAVDTSIVVMNKVVEQVESMRAGIRELSDQAELIRNITSTVDDIAERSNLLALNAAIEAARAGEEGRGFSVVAGEIRSLAEQSKRATVEVRGILGDIQRAAGAAVSVAEEGTRQAAESARLLAEAGDTIRQLGDTISDSSQAAAQIAASAGQQATGMAQIRQAMRNIREVTQQNLVATQQTERAAKDLSSIGATLVAMVGGKKQSRHG